MNKSKLVSQVLRKKVLLILIIVLAFAIGAILYLPNSKKAENSQTKPTNSSNASQTLAEAPQQPLDPKTVEDTTPPPKPAEAPSNAPTTQNTEPTEPPKTIDVLTKEYAKSKGETDYQTNCFHSIIGYRTNWNISEADMQAKYASIKEVYPSICACWNVVSKRPADAQLKGL